MPKLLTAIVLIMLGVTGTAEAHSLKYAKTKYGYGERLSHKVHHVVRATWNCQETLDRKRAKASGRYQFRPVAYRRYVLREWRKKLSSCTDDLRKVWYANVNWWLATDYANTIFPGTRGWLISCSSSEGGHTSWVSNRQGSGAGGWLQFMSGTFYAYVGDAFSAARSRGYLVLDVWKSWKSPAGQAITGGYMRWSGRDGSHWVGSGC